MDTCSLTGVKHAQGVPRKSTLLKGDVYEQLLICVGLQVKLVIFSVALQWGDSTYINHAREEGEGRDLDPVA